MTVVTYRGRRSGTVVSLPVSFVHDGDEVSIGVALPDQKSWWRNFTGDGHPLSIRLDGADRTGHGVAATTAWSESGCASTRPHGGHRGRWRPSDAGRSRPRRPRRARVRSR